MNLSLYLGDSPVFAIPLVWAGEAFASGEDWGLIFTLKYCDKEGDENAIVQKASGVGITITNYTAYVSFVSEDTENLEPFSGVWDVQAQNITTGEVRTVKRGNLRAHRDVTRKRQTTIPIKMHQDPAPFTNPLPEWLLEFTSITITSGDELELEKDGITYWAPLYRRA